MHCFGCCMEFRARGKGMRIAVFVGIGRKTLNVWDEELGRVEEVRR